MPSFCPECGTANHACNTCKHCGYPLDALFQPQKQVVIKHVKERKSRFGFLKFWGGLILLSALARLFGFI